ncbi:MAG: hypothetical protein ACRC9Z_02310 [Weissella confusa]
MANSDWKQQIVKFFDLSDRKKLDEGKDLILYKKLTLETLRIAVGKQENKINYLENNLHLLMTTSIIVTIATVLGGILFKLVTLFTKTKIKQLAPTNEELVYAQYIGGGVLLFFIIISALSIMMAIIFKLRRVAREKDKLTTMNVVLKQKEHAGD